MCKVTQKCKIEMHTMSWPLLVKDWYTCQFLYGVNYFQQRKSHHLLGKVGIADELPNDYLCNNVNVIKLAPV